MLAFIVVEKLKGSLSFFNDSPALIPTCSLDQGRALVNAIPIKPIQFIKPGHVFCTYPRTSSHTETEVNGVWGCLGYVFGVQSYRTSGGGPGCLGIWSNDQRTVGTGGVLQRLVQRCLVCGHGEKEIDIISHWCLYIYILPSNMLFPKTLDPFVLRLHLYIKFEQSPKK